MTRMEKNELLEVLLALRLGQLEFAQSKLRLIIRTAQDEHAAEDAANDALGNKQRGNE